MSRGGDNGRARTEKESHPVTRTVLPAFACQTLLLSVYSGDDTDENAASTTTAPATSEAETEPASDEPFGPGCAGLPPEGEGSVAGMADDPLFVAASNNPELSTLVQAVTAARLGDTLNSTANITVLAPTNAAFAAVPPDQLQALLGDTARLTATLVHHVVPGRLGPD